MMTSVINSLYGFHIINPRKGTETAIAIYIHLQVSDYLIPARGLKGCKMRIIKTI